jgi:hypothetical protein
MKKRCWYFLGLVILLLVVGKVGQAQDSLGMHHVATLDYWQGASDIKMVGNLAYVFSHSSGLHIVDLTDAANPQELGRCTWYDWDDPVGGIYVMGNRAYAATNYGCCAFDVSDPTHPVQLARWWEDRSLSAIFVHDSVAIITIAQESLGIPVVTNISDLGNVQQIGDFGGEHLSPVGMVGDYLFMVRYWSGLLVYDFSDPSQPVQVAQVDSAMAPGGSVIAGDYIYFGTQGHGVRIIDISNPLQLVEIDSFESGSCSAVNVSGTHLVTYKYGYLNIWNITDPLHPVLEGVFPLTVSFNEVAGSGNLVCLGYYMNPVAVALVDISNPAAPVQVSSFGTNASLFNMTIVGTVAYIGGGWASSLRTISLADPEHPFNLGVVGGQSGDIAVCGNYAYMTDRNHGVLVFDVSNPAEPESLHCTPGGYPQKIVTAGAYAYVISTDQGFPVSLLTLSLQDPTEPVQVSSLSVPHYTLGDAFGAQNGYLYLGASSASYVYLYAYSLANPAAPQLVGTGLCPNSYWCDPMDIGLTEHYAYIANYAGGLVTFDITDSENPVMVNQMLGDTITHVAAFGNTVVTDGNARINVLDMTDPTDPRNVGYYPTLEIIRDIRILGSHVITISRPELRVYQCDALSNVPSPPEVVPNEFNLYPCYPNPFNPSTVISYFVPHQSKLCLDIYNILGQRITTLYNGTRIAGQHRVIWDASDIASGIYFCRMSAPGFQSIRKMVLIK